MADLQLEAGDDLVIHDHFAFHGRLAAQYRPSDGGYVPVPVPLHDASLLYGLYAHKCGGWDRPRGESCGQEASVMP